MKLLEERILKDGEVSPGNVIKVDSFINHQIDTVLLSECAKEWYEAFKDTGVTKILTIDGSGIGIACLAARYFGVPVLFAKKSSSTSKVSDEFYSTNVISFTHGHEYNVVAKKKFISKEDKILIIDDFLAMGEALRGVCEIVNQSGAELVGIGVAVEKGFQPGGQKLRDAGYHVESLAIIESADPVEGIVFRGE